MFEKGRPIAFADAHSLMGELHVTALVIHRAARTRAEKIHEELPLPLHSILAAILPEASQLRISLQAIHQIVTDGRDGIITAEAIVKRFVSHDLCLLRFAGCVPLYTRV